MIKKYVSPIDNCEFDYQIVNGNLSYKIEGTDWQDFILEDKRAYSKEQYAEFLSLLEVNSMRQLTLTNEQFDVLFDILQDTVDVIEGDLITTEDENGNEILEDITEYEAHKIYQQMVRLSGGF